MHVGQQSGSSGGNGGLRMWQRIVGKDLWGVAGSNCCTFEHLFLITPFVLDIANGSHT